MSSTPYTPPPETILHFQKHPIFAPLISLQEYTWDPIWSHDNTGLPDAQIYNAFFQRTLATPSTIPHSLGLRLRTLPPVPATPPSPPSVSLSADAKPSHAASPEQIPHLLWLVHLASPGISSWPSVIHGGVLAAILDEAVGTAVERVTQPGRPTYTVRLDTVYRRHVAAPGDYLVKAWVVAGKGRKWWTRAEVVMADGTVCTEGSALHIEGRVAGEKL